MYKYLDIVNVSILVTGLYIVSTNLIGNRGKKSAMQFIMMLTVIYLKVVLILDIDNYGIYEYISVISDLILLILLVDIELIECKNRKIISTLNYLAVISILFIDIYIGNKLYITIIELYILISSLYLLSTYILKNKFHIKYILHFLYFGEISMNLILSSSELLANINSVFGVILSIYMLLRVFNLYVKDSYKKSTDIVSKINRSNINIKIHNEKLNMKKSLNNDMSELINKKESLLKLMLKDFNKCIFMIDEENYISNEDKSFYFLWNEYEDYKYNINLDFFCKNSIKDSEEFKAAINLVKTDCRELEFEIIDNKNRILSSKLAPIKLSNDKNGVICIMTDITSKKNIEMKIKDNATKYKKIVDNIPYSVLVTSRDEILYNNDKNQYIDFNKDDIKNIILGKYPIEELYYTYNNGMDVCLNIEKIKYIDGEEPRNLFVIRDITNYKNVLKLLEYSKRKYESLVNIIPEGIYVMNFENRVLKYANNAFFSMLGTNELSNIDIDNISKNIAVASGNINDNVKYKRDVLINNLGQEINIECGGMLLDINKKIKMIGIVRDITEQIKAEMIEREIEEKENLSRSKTEFFINMSHELKTPLNLIHSSNQLIDVVYSEELKRNNKIDILETIGVVKKHVNILMSLIDNIIELAKLQADFHEVQKDYYNIVDISENIVDELSRFMNEGVNIIFDTDDEEKIANIDPDDIEKVILILLSIVVKYSMDKSNVYFNLGSRKDYISMSIKNIGGYEYKKYSNYSERKVLDMGITLAKLIVELYEGNLIINAGPDNSIEILVEIKADYEIKKYKNHTINRQEGFIYSEYKKMCSF